MGALCFFDEIVDSNNNAGKHFKCSVEVTDNHSVPEIRIGPEEEAYKGWVAEFDDWAQFERFVEAVNSLHFRLEGIPR